MRNMLISAVEALPPDLRFTLKDKLFYQPIIKHHAITAERPALFDTVFFEVITKCNSRCSFCAASKQNEKREPLAMPFATYSKVVDELVDLGFTGRVAYHVNNEPLLFPELASFIAYAREKLPAARKQVMTNGMLLTAKRGAELIESGVDEIHVDFYRERGDQPLYPGVREFMEQTIPSFFPNRENGKFVSADGTRRFSFKIEYRFLKEVISSRGGTSPNKRTERREEVRGFCVFPWTQFNVTASGVVNKCCADLYFSDVMGNVNEESVLEIWHGERLTRVRERLLRGERAVLPNCRECDYIGFPNRMLPYKVLRAVRYNFFDRKALQI